MSQKPTWEIIRGDALKVIPTFAPDTFDAIITDPPYASGSRDPAQKLKPTTEKYSSMGKNAPPAFKGEVMDQMCWTRWMTEVLSEAYRVCKEGAPLCLFIDWRMYYCAAEAIQRSNWIWRGVVVWDKGNSRPQKGRFRQQTEFILWGSKGKMDRDRNVPCLAGLYHYGNPGKRIHLTEKPLQLMQDIVHITEPGGHILDPFAGAGTTVLGSVLEGYDATGIEVTDVYAMKARQRIEQALNPVVPFRKPATGLKAA